MLVRAVQTAAGRDLRFFWQAQILPPVEQWSQRSKMSSCCLVTRSNCTWKTSLNKIYPESKNHRGFRVYFNSTRTQRYRVLSGQGVIESTASSVGRNERLNPRHVACSYPVVRFYDASNCLADKIALTDLGLSIQSIYTCQPMGTPAKRRNSLVAFSFSHFSDLDSASESSARTLRARER